MRRKDGYESKATYGQFFDKEKEVDYHVDPEHPLEIGVTELDSEQIKKKVRIAFGARPPFLGYVKDGPYQKNRNYKCGEE